MAIVGKRMGRDDLEPYEYFDLVGGTSTGGYVGCLFLITPSLNDELEPIVTRTEPIHRAVTVQFDSRQQIYHRFNVDRGLEMVQLFQHEKKEEIEVDTDAYLYKEEILQNLIVCTTKMKDLGVRRPELLDNRRNENEVFSLGADGNVDDESLRRRLQELRIPQKNFYLHEKEWKSQVSKEGGSLYYQELYHETHPVPYLWNAIVQADLLDKRGRDILSKRPPPLDEPQLLPSGDIVRFAYDQSNEAGRTASQFNLAHENLRNAFYIYRQLLYTTQTIFRESSPAAYSWVAKRLASILELWGCRKEANMLYVEARNGKLSTLGKHHWAVRWLEAKVDQLSQE